MASFTIRDFPMLCAIESFPYTISILLHEAIIEIAPMLLRKGIRDENIRRKNIVFINMY